MLAKTFEEQISSLYQGKKTFQEAAWNQFGKVGLPSKSNEAFQYLRLRELFAKRLSLPRGSVDVLPKELVYPECQESVLVFVNGSPSRELSCLSAVEGKLEVLSLEKAQHAYQAFFSGHLANAHAREEDPFALLNPALQEEGVFLYLPPGRVLEAPLQILHLVTEEEVLVSPRLHIVLGKGAEMQVYHSLQESGGGSYWANFLGDLIVGEAAHLKVTTSMGALCPDAWVTDAWRVEIGRSASCTLRSCHEGAGCVRQDFRASLLQEGAEVDLQGITTLKERTSGHTHVLVEHLGPHCRSHQLFKSVLADSGHTSFEGKIFVAQKAQKTEAYQLNNNLLLSGNAKADCKPNLEIFADDVKASHGATMGQIDEEQRFYLRTRGYSFAEATNQLVHGFCDEVIQPISLKSLKDSLGRRVKRFLGET